MFIPVSVEHTAFGQGRDQLFCVDAAQPGVFEAFRGQVQAVYLDPPFDTGEHMVRKRLFGEEGWRGGRRMISQSGYTDSFESRETYLTLLRGLLINARELLTETGIVMLHLDWRMSAWGRLILEELFGEDCFINELIWAYESGGRAVRTFSRKHDTIYLFGRTPRWRLEPARAASQRRSERRRNHLRRGVDESGRKYGSIVVGGKEYRYYDDEWVSPGDVWTDISHLQQRDPERTGWPTQKPQQLLQRLLRCCLDAGETVADLCMGSGTTLAAGRRLGCRTLGSDLSPAAITGTAARLGLDNVTLHMTTPAEPSCRVFGHRQENGVIYLTGFETREQLSPEAYDPMDALEAWAPGAIRNGVFQAAEVFQRTRRAPALPLMSLCEALEGQPAVWTLDAAGNTAVFAWKEENDVPAGGL